ncbi:hypothetical protein K504DRAFT_205129 [Pleomassaria siparia CBS 279.74]|uniref:BZIP domain-containing protein n=1 Tax=Pleomassaria siparia CBS 279.74 TaxID=1314801 RepID=A0A6G1KI06_9PLEO|nr:hypothetical protein K504DRAFT_205129 [Pleomassaria siparia CBS 279.74]
MPRQSALEQRQLQHYYNSSSQFAQALTTPAMVSQQLTPPPALDSTPTTTIKMEDLSMSFSSPTPSCSALSTSQPTPSGSESRAAAKKRKSWGQVLPEPKTNLPPRKRAKTEDEKEQRRIERVKRNRLAAHNSRERKRQEVELLQAEKDKIEDELHAAQAALDRMSSELQAYRQKFPGAIPEHTFDTDASMDTYTALKNQANTICPRQASFPSPVSMDSMDSPRDDSCQPETPFSETSLPIIASNDSGFFPSLESLHPYDDEKPIESLFDFESFPENNEEPASMGDQSDLFSSTLFEHSSNTYGLSDQYDVKNFDLQTASGAALFACDGALAVDI